MLNIAVILAGGTGSRMGMNVPKQFIRLQDGRTVLETCVAAFQQNEHIDQIAIVMHPDHKDEAKQLLPIDRYDKVRYWIDGGSERWESSLHAIETINRKSSLVHLSMDVNVLLHDCARPFISQDLISRVCKALKAYKAVSVAVPVTDTIYLMKSGERGDVIKDVPTRFFVRAAQTPQAFRLSVIAEALQKAQKDVLSRATDDAGMVFRSLPKQEVYIIPGEPSNRKITFKEDLE